VGATLFYLTMLHDDDFVCIFNGAEPVSDYHNGLLTRANHLVKGLLNLVLTFGIESRCGLIE